MQKYREINGNDYVKDSRATINETMQSIQSMNSGTAFPTTNLFEGMKCYRTDLKKTYTLTDVENGTWVEDAHATLADTATKLQTPRTLSLTGKATGSATFDGSANAAINVTSVNADTASKLSTARKINITGNATGAATFDGTSDVSINVSVSQAAHADKATQDTNGRAFTDTNAYMHISALADNTDFNNVKTTGIYYCTGNTYSNRPHNSWGILTVYSIGTVKQEYRPDNEAVYYAREYNNANWTEWSKVAASTADSATNADTVDGYHENSFLRYRGPTSTNGEDTLWSQIGIKEYDNVLPESLTGAYTYGAVVSLPSPNNRLDLWYDCYASDKGTGLYYRTGWANDKHAWARLLDSNNYTKWAPTKTGSGASGTWDISITGSAASATTATNATNAGNADTVDGIHADSMFYNKGDWGADNWGTIGAYQVNNNSPVSNAYGWGQVISISTKNARFQLYASDQYGGNGRLHYRTGWDNSEIYQWTTILDSDNYNLFAPTKTGGGASGTWGINISGNAASATNADTVDGYHASDIINRISAANTGGIVAASLTENGYVKFANGLILQWGTGSNNNWVSFPISFGSFARVVCTCTNGAWVWAGNVGRTGFNFEADGGGNWIAVGA